MPDEPTEQVIEPTGAEPQEPTQPTLEQVLKQNEELSRSLEQRTSELKGTDKKLGEINKQFSEFRTQHETDKQRTERESIELKEAQELERTNFYTEKSNFEKDRTKWQVEKKAFDLGFTVEDIEQLKFTSIEHVESTRSYLEKVKETTKQDTANEIESKLSGNREVLNNKPSEVVRYPKAIDKAFR